MSFPRVTIETPGVEWREVYWRNLQSGFERELGHLLQTWKVRIVAEMKSAAPVLSGKLRGSVHGYLLQRGAEEFELYFASSLFYSMWQEFGTGLYSDAPNAPRRVIYAKYAKSLKIPIGNVSSIQQASFGQAFELRPGKKRAGRMLIFRNYQRGAHPTRFMRETIRELWPLLQADVVKLMSKYGFN